MNAKRLDAGIQQQKSGMAEKSVTTIMICIGSIMKPLQEIIIDLFLNS